jgi:hypothetical protein
MHMRDQKLPKEVLSRLEGYGETTVPNECARQALLQSWKVTNTRHVRIVTEGALLASVLSHGIRPDLAVVSDDAGQFNILVHVLCWIHAERTLAKLIGFNEEQRQTLQAKLTEVWDFYRDLKAYKTTPTADAKAKLSQRFDDIFTAKTGFTLLNKALERLHRNKAELLMVLERPELPLHNNLSESDIREQVLRRKRNGATWSDLGRRCRDTFASLKKTCRKLKVSFWHYLLARCSGSDTVPFLPDLVRQRALEAHT